MISINNVSKSYGDKLVLDNVSLNLNKGSLNMIVGGNGAGKSTLINIMGSVLDLDNGEIIIDGIKLNDYTREDKAKKIALLKQENHINLSLTARDLVGFGRFPYTKGKLNEEDYRVVDECLKKTETYEFKDRDINKLSGGQRQRVFLAMILAQETDIILLDEPLSSLDLRHSVEFVTLLRKICKEEDKTVLMIVHDLNVAAQSADVIVALKDGKLEACGCVNDVIEQDCLYKVFGVDFVVQEIEDRKICYIK